MIKDLIIKKLFYYIIIVKKNIAIFMQLFKYIIL